MTDKSLIQKVDCARWWALQNAPFYAMLAMALSDRLTDQPTASTDGRTIKWGRAFLARLSERETRFVLLHEVLHCAHGHFWRLPFDEAGQQAGDYAINATLAAAAEDGLEIKMPESGLLDSCYNGKAEEEILASLRKRQPQGGGGAGKPGQPGGKGGAASQPAPGQPGAADGGEDTPGADGEPGEGSGAQGEGAGEGNQPPADPGACGGFEQPAEDPQPAEDGPAESNKAKPADTLREEWEQRIVQAAMAQKSSGKGTMPAGGQILLDRVRGQRVDWRNECAEFVKNAIGARNDWARASRRMATAPVIYPRRRRDTCGLIVFARDTSGSVDAQQVAAFNALIEDCLGECGTAGVILDCDAKVQGEYRIEAGEEAPATAKGGGGTAFAPVFARVAELLADGDQIAGVIYLTDGAGSFPAAADVPDVPALWVLTEKTSVPFGRSVQIN